MSNNDLKIQVVKGDEILVDKNVPIKSVKNQGCKRKLALLSENDFRILLESSGGDPAIVLIAGKEKLPEVRLKDAGNARAAESDKDITYSVDAVAMDHILVNNVASWHNYAMRFIPTNADHIILTVRKHKKFIICLN